MSAVGRWLFAEGHAADIVLVVMLAEAMLLLSVRRAAGPVLGALAPGALMIVALRGALTGQAWAWIALPLALSGPAHLADLRQRGWLR